MANYSSLFYTYAFMAFLLKIFGLILKFQKDYTLNFTKSLLLHQIQTYLRCQVFRENVQTFISNPKVYKCVYQ